MQWSKESSREVEVCLRAFVMNHMEEIGRANEFLSPEEALELRHYYRHFVDNPLRGDALDRHVRGGARSTYGFTLKRILGAREKGKALRVLDAGCGLGTECILFALSGGSVVGIDLREERLRIAPKRAAFYERELGVRLDTRFVLSNVFDLPERGVFDLIWVHNAISHIHPVDTFLSFCRELLAPGGEVVIIDVNKMNWRQRLSHSHHEEGPGLYTTRKDPTGKDVVYAVERDLTLAEQCAVLQASGLKVVSRECYVGFHGRASRWLYDHLLLPVNRSMLLSARLGSRYVVVGRKD